jgi:hypothetical protein
VNSNSKLGSSVAILQPSYLPWLGFFEQMFKVEVFVIYDEVQFDKNGWRNRNRIKTVQGAQWLTVPVLTKGKSKPANHAVKVNSAVNWNQKHLKSIELNYKKLPFFNDFSPKIEEVLKKNWNFLLDLNLNLIYLIKDYLGIDTPIKLSSEIPSKIETAISPEERLVEICRFFGATTFYEGYAGKKYIEESFFSKSGIKLVFQEYHHPIYRQGFGEFVPYLSTIDLIFNEGPDSLKILSTPFKKQ